MGRLIKFFQLSIGLSCRPRTPKPDRGAQFLTPAEANSGKHSLRYWRCRINKQLKFGQRVLQVPNEFFGLVIQELRDKGWHVEMGLGQHSNKLRDIYVGDWQ